MPNGQYMYRPRCTAGHRPPVLLPAPVTDCDAWTLNVQHPALQKMAACARREAFPARQALETARGTLVVCCKTDIYIRHGQERNLRSKSCAQQRLRAQSEPRITSQVTRLLFCRSWINGGAS